MLQISRRSFMQMAAASTVVAGASAGSSRASTQSAGTGNLIDTHHHIFPPGLQDWLVNRSVLPQDRSTWPNWAQWSLDETIEMMESVGIVGAIASQPAPLSLFPTAGEAREWTRVINESSAEVIRDNPKRFGFFAYLPLNHPAVMVEEAVYALDELDADGVMCITHSGDKYLGHPDYAELLSELNRRKATLFLHPDRIDLPSPESVPYWLTDFMLATTRTALSLILSGALDRNPALSIILSHAGGFLPYIHGRIFHLDETEGRDGAKAAESLKRFYYDTALPMSPYATAPLLQAALPDRILFGTDWPQVQTKGIAEQLAEMREDKELDSALRQKIMSDNAGALFPRFAS